MNEPFIWQTKCKLSMLSWGKAVYSNWRRRLSRECLSRCVMFFSFSPFCVSGFVVLDAVSFPNSGHFFQSKIAWLLSYMANKIDITVGHNCFIALEFLKMSFILVFLYVYCWNIKIYRKCGKEKIILFHCLERIITDTFFLI